MKGRSQSFTQLPLSMTGGTRFGRYPKISIQQTYNMLNSDGFCVPYAGYEVAVPILQNSEGRGIYTSQKANRIFLVIGDGFYSIAPNLTHTRIHTIDSDIGDVFMDENNNNEIGICDKENIYIYNYLTGAFSTAVLDSGFIPGYISFQNGRFIAPALGTNIWRLSGLNDGTSWSPDDFFVGELSTKPDICVAAKRFPGRGNLLYVFGKTVVEQWTDVGYSLFPYQRSSTTSIDYGCINPATIASNNTTMVWMGSNEQTGPVLMFSSGGDVQRISNDGLDFQFGQLTNPTNCYGFLFQQDGHELYQFTWPDDDLSYVYDFNTRQLSTLCDEYMSAHIAKRAVYFNNNYYFISFKDGNLYKFSSEITTYDGKEIPRIIVCPPIRLPDGSRFCINNLTFIIEEGISYEDRSIPQKVGLSVSKNGGQSFGSIWTKELNAVGKRKNRLNYWNLGSANEFIPQFRFWGLNRFVFTDGIVSIYQ